MDVSYVRACAQSRRTINLVHDLELHLRARNQMSVNLIILGRLREREIRGGTTGGGKAVDETRSRRICVVVRPVHLWIILVLPVPVLDTRSRPSSYDDMQDRGDASVKSKHVIPDPPCPAALGLRGLGAYRGSYSVSGARVSDDASGSISSISLCFPSQPLPVVCVSDANQPVMRMTKAVDDIHHKPRNTIIT